MFPPTSPARSVPAQRILSNKRAAVMWMAEIALIKKKLYFCVLKHGYLCLISRTAVCPEEDQVFSQHGSCEKTKKTRAEAAILASERPSEGSNAHEHKTPNP